MSRVFVLGNATLDCIQRVARLPIAGETLLCDALQRCAGGKGLNQAIACARTGAATVLAAPVGDDPEAAMLSGAAAGEDGLEARWLASAAPTDHSAIWVARDGENAIVSSAAAARGLGESDALAALHDLAAGDMLVMQGNLSAAVTAAAARFARAREASCLLNTAPIAWDMRPVLGLFDIVVANAVEAQTLAAGDPARAALALSAGRTAVVTRGAAGALLARDGQVAEVPAPTVRAVDTAGAGDVLVGTLVGFLAQKRAIEGALRLAVAAASIAVTRHGTVPSFPSRADVSGLDRG